MAVLFVISLFFSFAYSASLLDQYRCDRGYEPDFIFQHNMLWFVVLYIIEHHEPDFSLPDDLDDYLLTESSEGRVYVLQLQRCVVAVKCPKRSFDLSTEYHHLRHLAHPFIVEVYGFIQGCIVMKRYDMNGKEAQLHLRYPKELISRMAMQLLSALDFVHSKELLLNDIKPENILLSSDEPHLVFADFGLVTKEGERTTYNPWYSGPEYTKTRASDILAFTRTLQVFFGYIPSSEFHLRSDLSPQVIRHHFSKSTAYRIENNLKDYMTWNSEMPMFISPYIGSPFALEPLFQQGIHIIPSKRPRTRQIYFTLKAFAEEQFHELMRLQTTVHEGASGGNLHETIQAKKIGLEASYQFPIVNYDQLFITKFKGILLQHHANEGVFDAEFYGFHVQVVLTHLPLKKFTCHLHRHAAMFIPARDIQHHSILPLITVKDTASYSICTVIQKTIKH